MIYNELAERYTRLSLGLNNRYNLVSILRFFAILLSCVCFYFFAKYEVSTYLIFVLAGVVGFVVLMKIHDKISWKKDLNKALIDINSEEEAYLKGEGIPFSDGKEFNDFSHLYAYDLDLFGAKSLFQHLNRTETYIGGKKLSDRLLYMPPPSEILENQEAVKELSTKLDWRQHLKALARISSDTKDVYTNLLKWTKQSSENVPQLLILYAYLAPFLFFGALVLYGITGVSTYSSVASWVFVFNLMIVGTQAKKIKQEIAVSGKIDETLKQYSLIIQSVEKEDFKSKKLNELKSKLTENAIPVSSHIQTLSGLFSGMDSIQNFIGAMLFNGTFLYHIHTLGKLQKWKIQYGSKIENWLDIIGKIEALSSIANFSYNNPAFAFPQFNDTFQISLEDLGHPLIKSEKRVCNSVHFDNHRFIILTGSNMSGKSTFLRTLGINMVLAGTGAPLCCTKADIHPLEVIVSMRLSDSLSDSESYFFAEVKRLKLIMEKLENKTCFVLLDEILRGTNSDDKRNGTIEVIKKMVQKNAVGAIATHDLEVCLTTDLYPDFLTNKCFEVEIINDELAFDYKLRDGICKNKSATFLMKKMKVI